jgi:hypothetical protein
MTEESATADDPAAGEVQGRADDAGADQPEGRAEQHSSLTSFDQADLKLLVVTFAGTLAANIVTAFVVAIAIIEARPGFLGRPTLFHDLFEPAFGLALSLSTIIVVRISGRGNTTARERRFTSVSILIMGLFACSQVLVLLGLALGVK